MEGGRGEHGVRNGLESVRDLVVSGVDIWNVNEGCRGVLFDFLVL